MITATFANKCKTLKLVLSSYHTLVEYYIIEEEFHDEPSQKIFIVDRCPLRILLSLKIPFHFMEPRFVCYLFSVNLIAVCWFIQPLIGDPRNLIVPLELENR